MIILIKHAGGGVGVMHASPEQEESALSAYADKWAGTDFAYISHRKIGEGEIPPDRTFRNAWVDSGEKIVQDMPKCREIWRNRLRELRGPKFEPLERAQRTALASGNMVEARRLEVELQKLRDVTADPAIEAAATPEQLKAVMPTILA